MLRFYIYFAARRDCNPLASRCVAIWESPDDMVCWLLADNHIFNLTIWITFMSVCVLPVSCFWKRAADYWDNYKSNI